jgi:hypothetical protein
MYTIDELDNVVELTDVPPPEAGAPLPVVVATDHELAVEYYVSSRYSPLGEEPSARVAEQFAYVRFTLPYAHMFGPPNDEAFMGHPLAARGLSPYAVSEGKRSSWIRQLERMNRVHRYHEPEHFAKYRHFVFAFHDSTFECVATALEFQLGREARLHPAGKIRRAMDNPKE